MKTDCVLISFDFRGHGISKQEEPTDLSTETLIQDSLRVLKHVAFNMEEFKNRTLLIVGHSMGGAICSKLVSHITGSEDEKALQKLVKGYFVIDVVEGSALEVLPMME